MLASLVAAVAVALNGAPKAEVVYPAGSHPVVKFAADDLAYWVKEISGAELPVSEKSPSEVCGRGGGPCRIFVGTEFARGVFDGDIGEIGDTDGFAIRERGGDIYLFGGRPRSAVYATSRLLEENTDIIWARPAAEFGTVFTKSPTIELKMTSRLEMVWMRAAPTGPSSPAMAK